VTLNGTGADANSGMASMRFEYKLSAGSTWSTACTDVTPPSPFSCSWNTAAIADGTYDLRSVAIDAAGNTLASTPVTSRVVDNTAPAVSIASPGTFRTSTTVTATATDAVGVANVVLEYSVSGANSWTSICTDNATPFSCPWNAAALSDGAYDVRAIATDTAGNQATSALGSAYVNNTGPTGTDIQGGNGGSNDEIDPGDSLVFTYSEAITQTSILAGWAGASANVRVRVTNSGVNDTISFYDAANTTALGLLATGTTIFTGQDLVNTDVLFAGTITRSGAVITVTVGAQLSGTTNTKVKTKTFMTWQSNAQATSLATGKPTLPTTVTESGTSDMDF
jgi:hypothetical protein